MSIAHQRGFDKLFLCNIKPDSWIIVNNNSRYSMVLLNRGHNPITISPNEYTFGYGDITGVEIGIIPYPLVEDAWLRKPEAELRRLLTFWSFLTLNAAENFIAEMEI